MDIWILLADTRQKLLRLWMVFAVFIIGLILLMTVLGKFEDIVGTAWLWALSSILPMLGLLYLGVALNPQPSKVIKKATFHGIFYGAIAYLLLVLGTLLAMPFFLNYTEGSVADYFRLSYIWLVPFQSVLLAAAWILYFRKTLLFQPNEKILLEYAQKKADYAHRFGNLRQQTAFDHLLKNDYPSVFEALRQNLTDNDSRNDSLLLQGQYTQLNEKRGFDTLEPAQAQRELNRITVALIELIEKL